MSFECFIHEGPGVLENDQKVFSGKEGGSKNKINSEGE